MRAAPLTAIQAGIDRQRLKGGARADSLYDLVNAFVNKANSVVVRPGTARPAALDPATRGLVAFEGKLWTFCDHAVDVPYGYELGILVSPDSGVVAPGLPALAFTDAFEMTADRKVQLVPPYNKYAGVDIYHSTPTGPMGSVVGFSGGAVDVKVHACYGYTNSTSFPLLSGIFAIGLEQGNTGDASTTLFDSVTFTDAHGVARTFNRVDAIAPTGGGTSDLSPSTSFRKWEWAITPSAAEIFISGQTYTITVNFAAGTPSLEAPVVYALKKIHFAEPFMGAPYVVAEFENGGVYHYWLQPGVKWEASKAYKAGDLVHPSVPNGFVYRATRAGNANPPWAPNVPRYDGTGPEAASVIEPTVYNDYFYTCTAVTGATPRSGTTEPAWPTDEGATVIESTDNAPDVVIPTSTPTPPSSVIPSSTQSRYGTFANRLVTR